METPVFEGTNKLFIILYRQPVKSTLTYKYIIRGHISLWWVWWMQHTSTRTTLTIPLSLCSYDTIFWLNWLWKVTDTFIAYNWWWCSICLISLRSFVSRPILQDSSCEIHFETNLSSLMQSFITSSLYEDSFNISFDA